MSAFCASNLVIVNVTSSRAAPTIDIQRILRSSNGRETRIDAVKSLSPKRSTIVPSAGAVTINARMRTAVDVFGGTQTWEEMMVPFFLWPIRTA